LKFGISDKGYIDLEITEALVKLQTFPKGDQVSRDGEEFPTGNTVSSDTEKFPTGNRVSSDAEKFPTGNRVSSDAREFPTVPSSFLQETPSHCGKHPRTVGNDQVPEPSQEKESSASKIIKTYTIFLYSRHNECRLGKHSSVDVCHGFRNLV
jgi:hypothetical protein